MSPRHSSSSGSDSSGSTLSNNSTILIFPDDHFAADNHRKAQACLDIDLDELPMLPENDDDAPLLDDTDDDLPPPYPGFGKKDEKGKVVVIGKEKRGGVRIVLNTHPRQQQFLSPTPSPSGRPITNRFFLPSNSQNKTRPQPQATSPSAYAIKPSISPHKILCCDLVRPRYKPTIFTTSSITNTLTHLINPNTTSLILNFLAFGGETAYSREFEATGLIEVEQRFVIVLQKVLLNAKERNSERNVKMGRMRWFVPVLPVDERDGDAEIEEGIVDSDEDTDTDTDTDMDKDYIPFRTSTSKSKGKENIEVQTKQSSSQIENRSLLPASHPIHAHLKTIEEKLNTDLMELEERLDEEVEAGPANMRALMPKFAGMSFGNSLAPDPSYSNHRGKVGGEEWQQGQMGFKEWFPTVVEGEGGEEGEGKGDGEGVDVLSDYLPIEGRTGRIDVRCWQCDKDWVLTVREKAVTV